jgi:hypothetical protein
VGGGEGRGIFFSLYVRVLCAQFVISCPVCSGATLGWGPIFLTCSVFQLLLASNVYISPKKVTCLRDNKTANLCRWRDSVAQIDGRRQTNVHMACFYSLHVIFLPLNHHTILLKRLSLAQMPPSYTDKVQQTPPTR